MGKVYPSVKGQDEKLPSQLNSKVLYNVADLETLVFAGDNVPPFVIRHGLYRKTA